MTPESWGIFVQSGKRRSENILKVHIKCTKAVYFIHTFLEDEFHILGKRVSHHSILRRKVIF